MGGVLPLAPTAVPTLDELAANPERAAMLPPAALHGLLCRCINLQSALFGALLTTVATPQLSPTAGLPNATPVALHWPASAFTVTFAGQVIVGSMVSCTVTLAVQVLVLPHTSTNVNVTGFGPMSPQPKIVWLIVRASGPPQLSKLPPSTCAAVRNARPLESRSTVMFVQTATGGVVSFTVMVWVQPFVLPELSVAKYWRVIVK